MNKLWVGETKVFNWLFSWPLNCQFGDMESSKKLESYVCVLSSDSKTDEPYMWYKLCKFH